MDATTAATRSAAAVSQVGSHFMLDGSTYKRGAELGFQGLDFYVTGRGGALGDVDADVVSAAFTFFEPTSIRTLWAQGTAVLPPAPGRRGVRGVLRHLGGAPRARRSRRRPAG